MISLRLKGTTAGLCLLAALLLVGAGGARGQEEHEVSLPELPVLPEIQELQVSCLAPLKVEVRLAVSQGRNQKPREKTAVAEANAWTVWSVPVQSGSGGGGGGGGYGYGTYDSRPRETKTTVTNRMTVLASQDTKAPAALLTPAGTVFFVTSGPRPSAEQLEQFRQTVFTPGATPGAPGVFRYWLEMDGEVAVSIVPRQGNRGRPVWTTTQKNLKRGMNELSWDGKSGRKADLAPGFYEARFVGKARSGTPRQVYAFAVYLQVAPRTP
uniref:Uncharacterized protein n=1 Tax=uncultured Armatimonadetes bacterium TaxID=157466 RepID=A0A6J4H5D0_9BACT|nr:hypothetical protein AVDCRST_MAG63-100 [uncultured Armatimonadetes bacterium]